MPFGVPDCAEYRRGRKDENRNVAYVLDVDSSGPEEFPCQTRNVEELRGACSEGKQTIFDL